MTSSKRVLITGKGSYIGTSMNACLASAEQYHIVDEVCIKGDDWREMDFTNYDAIIHVAGIVHSDTGKLSDEAKRLYYEVNTELTVEVAKKAKLEGVSQFIFMSSMSVYGDSGLFGVKKRITRDTAPAPNNVYGDSKLKAELELGNLAGDGFKIAIIRPPMVYGKGSKGNYPRLVKLAKKSPLFPDVDNERSMIHIDNLCGFIRCVLKESLEGTFHPQNDEHVRTSDLVVQIAKAHQKKLRLTKVFNPFLRTLAKRNELINKVFGNLSYDLSLSEYGFDYRIYSFKESIELTEK